MRFLQMLLLWYNESGHEARLSLRNKP